MDKETGTDRTDIALMTEMEAPQECETDTYLADLDGLDLSDQEKRDLIHTLWRFMEDCVRLEYGLDPITALELAKRANDLALMVSSEGALSDNQPTKVPPMRGAEQESE